MGMFGVFDGEFLLLVARLALVESLRVLDLVFAPVKESFLALCEVASRTCLRSSGLHLTFVVVGHGGPDAAMYIKANLFNNLKNHKDFTSNIDKATSE